MIEDQLLDEDVTRVLKKLKWEALLKHKPEYVIMMVVRRLRKEGIAFVKPGSRKKIKVEPVTRHGNDSPLFGQLVYNQFSGWVGEVLKEWNNGTVDLCVVRIRKKEGSSSLKTTIQKDDLCELKK